MTNHLEHSHGQGVLKNCFCGHTEPGKADDGRHEEQAISCHEAELDEGKGDRITKLHKDGLPSIGGEGRGRVPKATEEDEDES